MKLLPDSNLFPSGREHFKDWSGLDAGSMAAVLAELARSEDHLFVVLARIPAAPSRSPTR